MRAGKRYLLLLALLVAAAGCGAKVTRQAVTGAVTWKGQPLDTGMIRFLPLGGTAKTEAIAVIAGGKYAIPQAHGLDPGTYSVSVSSPDPKTGVNPDAPPGERGGYPATERIQAKYNVQTVLKFEVRPDGPNKFDVAVE